MRQVLSSSGGGAVEVQLDAGPAQDTPTNVSDVGTWQPADDRAFAAGDTAPHASNSRSLIATDEVFAVHVEEITSAQVSATSGNPEESLEPSSRSALAFTSADTEYVFATTPGEELTDYQVGCLIADKNEAGLHELIARSGGRTEGYLRTHFGLTQEDAEEAFQDGLVRVWKYFEPSRGKSVSAYFVLCADSAAKDILRRHDYPTDAISLSAISNPPFRSSGPTVESQVDLKHAIGTALDQLTERERDIIQADLNAGGKASNKDLARTFDLTSSAITRARSSAHAKLRRILADYAPAMDR
jgi:RNA polymerase sigma factor (sigma-70 family)